MSDLQLFIVLSEVYTVSSAFSVSLRMSANGRLLTISAQECWRDGGALRDEVEVVTGFRMDADLVRSA